jgi:hypothetical protein
MCFGVLNFFDPVFTGPRLPARPLTPYHATVAAGCLNHEKAPPRSGADRARAPRRRSYVEGASFAGGINPL